MCFNTMNLNMSSFMNNYLPPSLIQAPFPIDPLWKRRPVVASSIPWCERKDPEYPGIRQPLEGLVKLITNLHI
jgi:hypothetical protein